MTGRLVLLGAGGHAKVVIDIALDMGFEVAAMLAPDVGASYRGVPVMSDAELPAFPSTTHQLAVALGSNKLRVRLGNDATAAGYRLPPLISRSAVVSSTASIGEGAVIVAGAVVQSATQVGRLAIVNTASSVDHDGSVGEGAHVGPGCHLAGEVTVGNCSFLGAGVIAIPRVSIGDGTMVGAGSIVVRDLPPGVLALGSPASVRRDWMMS